MSSRSSQTPPPTHNRDIASSSSVAAPPSMEPIVPPGYIFLPSPKVLVVHYLEPFLKGEKNSFPNVPIHRVNIYESNPEQLSKNFKKENAFAWYFLTERTKNSEGGTQQIRRDNGGYWMPTKDDYKYRYRDGIISCQAYLEYYMGQEPNGVKSDWLMHEYWFESDDKKLEGHALCNIYLTPQAVSRRAEEEQNKINVAYQPPQQHMDPNVAIQPFRPPIDLNVPYQPPKQ